MKYLFLVLLIVLVVLSIGTYASYPTNTSKVPVIYWVTDRNPAREEQIRLFHEWLVKHDHVTEEGEPIVELRVDSANRDPTKQIIQGVSGVGGDIMDVASGGGMRYFNAIGLLEDVTDEAKAMGFDTSFTYEAMVPEISYEGRQYMFPCNVATSLIWVNKDTLERFNQPIPPRRWDHELFESMGERFVKAANPPGERRTVFYLSSYNPTVLHRGFGVSQFNETLTRPQIDDPKLIESWETLYRWTYQDHLLPSAADIASFSTESGYGGANMQLFNRGNYAMITIGRYGLIQLRKFGQLNLGVLEHPHAGYPNSVAATRSGTVYAGGKHKDLAVLFLAYLASEDYNMQIVRDADALPPNPVYTQTEEFLRPPDYPNEWGLHEIFSESMETIAIPNVNSPFVLQTLVTRHTNQARDAFMNDRLTAQEAAQQASRRIQAEIDRAVDPDEHADPKLVALYAERLEQQKQIDALRAAGKKVPAELIHNPFYLKYYRDMGWLEEEPKQDGQS